MSKRGSKFYEEKEKRNQVKQSYIKRHQKRENFNDPLTAGALSRWILWDKPSVSAAITAFKKRFNL